MTQNQYGRYDAYVDRMRFLYKIVDVLARFKYVILLVVASLCSATVAFLLYIGSFSTMPFIPNFSYGESESAQAEAFLSDVRYEYAAKDSDVWSAEAPTRAGEYKVRAISKNGFGKERYSEEFSFSIAKKPVTITVNDTNCTYGEEYEHSLSDLSVSDLAFKDRLTGVIFGFEEISLMETNVYIKDYTITNENGEDVTECYSLTAKSATHTFFARNITLSSETIEKIYDGIALTGSNESLKSGTLATGDRFIVTSRESIIDVGEKQNVFSVNFVDKYGKDVSEGYNVEYDFGTLGVKAREITIKTNSYEKTYDAKEIKIESYSITEGSLVSGHTLVISGFPVAAATGEITNAPTTYKILDADGNDLTINYKIKFEYGTIKINPIKLVFETGSAQKVYDATPLTKDGCKLKSGTLIKGHTYEVTMSGSQTDAGTSKNTAIVKIYDENGKNVTKEGYDIAFEYGTLEVTKRNAYVTTSSSSKVYDGTPLISRGYRCSGFLDGHMPLLNFTGSQTEVGSSDNTATLTMVRENAKNVTNNYNVSLTFGTLTVTANSNYKQPTQSEDTTIGFPKKSNGGGTPVEVRFTTPHETEVVYFREKSYGAYTHTGWKKGNVYYGTGSQQSLFFVGTQLLNRLGTSTSIAPTIEINKKGNNISLLPYYSHMSTVDACTKNDVSVSFSSKVYTATSYVGFAYDDIKKYTSSYTNESTYREYAYSEYLAIPASTKTELLRLAAENGIVADSPTLVTDIQKYIQNAAKYDMDAEALYPLNVEDVALYFLKTAKAGICQHFATAATLMYRAFGIPARYTVGYMAHVSYGKVTALTSDTAHAWTEIYVDGLGWVCMEVTGGGGSSSGGGGSAESGIGYGVTVYSAEKIYDGQAIGEWPYDKYILPSGVLKEGHRVEVELREDEAQSLVLPGTAHIGAIIRIFDEKGNDVSEEYSPLYVQGGTVTIHKRPITVQAASASQKYDGTMLQANEFWISSGSLLPGHILHATVSGAQTAVGSSANQVFGCYITDENGRVFTSYYNITTQNGTLTVYK